MFFISFVMVRNVSYSVNDKQYAVAANVRRSGHRIDRKDRFPNQAAPVVTKEKSWVQVLMRGAYSVIKRIGCLYCISATAAFLNNTSGHYDVAASPFKSLISCAK